MIAATSFWSFTRPTTWRGHSLLFLETILNVLSIVFQVLLFFILRVLQVLYFFILRVLQAWWNYADENRTFLEPPRVIFNGWMKSWFGKKIGSFIISINITYSKIGRISHQKYDRKLITEKSKKRNAYSDPFKFHPLQLVENHYQAPSCQHCRITPHQVDRESLE